MNNKEKETANKGKFSSIQEDNNSSNINKPTDIIKKNDNNIVEFKKIEKKNIKYIGLAIIPLIILTGMIYFLSSPYSQHLINTGVPIPEITIEKIEFHDNQIITLIRNTGPTEITISQADVNDRIQAAAIEPSKMLPRLSEAKIIIPFLWNQGEPYEIGITTSDGIRFSKIIQAAAATPIPNAYQVSVFAILGIYVGVIPIMIGLAWYPFMRKLSTNQYNFFLSLTAGLLVFLGIDALIESNKITIDNLASIFNGQMLIFIISIASFISLTYISERFTKRAIERLTKKNPKFLSFSTLGSSSVNNNSISNISRSKSDIKNQQVQSKLQIQQQIIKPLAISMMVSIGIGLHNFGEGLAIGAAVLLGKVALSTFLIIGFTLHNTTEGLAIVAPLAKTGKLMIKRLLLMGLIAGLPTILGTWVGGFTYSPIAAIVFLSIGAGAIFQVVYTLGRWMINSTNPTNTRIKNDDESVSKDITRSKMALPSASIITGFIVGMLIMYITGLLI
jgi:ZIP family zinc transporter